MIRKIIIGVHGNVSEDNVACISVG